LVSPLLFPGIREWLVVDLIHYVAFQRLFASQNFVALLPIRRGMLGLSEPYNWRNVSPNPTEGNVRIPGPHVVMDRVLSFIKVNVKIHESMLWRGPERVTVENLCQSFDNLWPRQRKIEVCDVNVHDGCWDERDEAPKAGLYMWLSSDKRYRDLDPSIPRYGRDTSRY
jgi:hypothetical protein